MILLHTHLRSMSYPLYTRYTAMNSPHPTIKGIFVNSHIARVRKEKGEIGVKKLTDMMGMPLVFKNGDNVLVRDEVRLIECALDIMSTTPVDPKTRAFDAGRLHFQNFSTTPLAKIIFSMFRTSFKKLMLQANTIAGHVFEGVSFKTEDLGEKTVRVTLQNNDYPIDHFRGLFYEWMTFAGLHGTVEATEGKQHEYIYTINWE
jgi:uncharacterized protein (TIGR02265 family)